MPSSSATSVASTVSLHHTSRNLSFWIYLLVAQISALSSQLFEVCHHALISSRLSERSYNTLDSHLGTNDPRRVFIFDPVIPEVTDSTLAAMRFMANLTFVISIGCVMSTLLLLAFLSTPTQSRHPHTRTMYAPSCYSRSPQSSSVRSEPNSIADGTTASSSHLIAKSILELAPGHSGLPSPCLSTQTPHILPWSPGTPIKRHPDNQREGDERQYSTPSFIRGRLNATPPMGKTHISICMDESPTTPPLTKDATRTPPSTGGLCRTPPSLTNHIRILTERHTTIHTRSHSRSSSFESPGVASLSMRIGHDPRFFHDNEDEDGYPIPPSPTPLSRKKDPIAPIFTMDVREAVNVERDLPPLPTPRPRTDSTASLSARRRPPRRPWTIADRIEDDAGNEGGTPSNTRSTLSTFFSKSIAGRWSDIFHLGGGGQGSHSKSASNGSLRRSDAFERLNDGDVYEKSGQKFSPLEQWELEILELGLQPSSTRSSTATITPPKRTPKESPVCLDAQLQYSSSWLSDPDPFAAPPRGAVTFVSSVKDRGVTKFEVGESREDFERSPTPTRMSAWGRVMLPVPSPSPSPPQLAAVSSLPAQTTASETRTGRLTKHSTSKKNIKPDSSVMPVPPLPLNPSPASISTTTHYLPGLPKSFSTSDVGEESFFSSQSIPGTSNALASASGTPSSPHEMPVEEALLAQRLLRKLNRDNRQTSSSSGGKKGRARSAGRNEKKGEGDSAAAQKRSKSAITRRKPS